MLQEINEFPGNVTIFEKYKDGENWMVRETRNNRILKETYCLNEQHAEEVRGQWVNEFWSFKLN